ncbi:MAG: TIGR02300 family protein [Holosporales bacterium]|nr:TIGR02300 family protein [Holosporales bacterium]
MTKIELGRKHVCTSCESKFYDLNRSRIACPQCNTEIDLKYFSNKKQKDKKVKKAELVEEIKTDDLELDVISEDEDTFAPEDDVEQEA